MKISLILCFLQTKTGWISSLFTLLLAIFNSDFCNTIISRIITVSMSINEYIYLVSFNSPSCIFCNVCMPSFSWNIDFYLCP